MRIDPANLPLHIARAYGVQSQRPTSPTNRTNAATSNFSLRPDRYDPGGPIRQLIAGAVTGKVDFSAAPGATKPASQQQVLQLYTRAADKVEAAVAVHVGRTLDVRG
jgi:hypothetical protein